MRGLLIGRNLAAFACAVVIAGCSETRLPVEPAVSPETLEAATFTCEASTRTRTVTCALPQASLAAGNGTLNIGMQGTHVQLTSTNVDYNSALFTFDVDVQNLIPQPLGTTDGATPDPKGVRVFFLADPVATVGNGTITVNGDGVATFTSAGQAYYQYSGSDLGGDGILSQNETSAAKTWTLQIPNTVENFAFRVLVAAEVPYPEGYVDVTPRADTLLEGATQALSATVRNAYGHVVSGSVAWGSSNEAVATVAADGTVTGVAPGTVTITAMSGTLVGSTTIAVCKSLTPGESYTPASGNFCLAGGAVGAEYTIVPTNASASNLSYSITSSGIVPVVGGPNPDLIANFRTLGAQRPVRDDEWEIRFREREREQVQALRHTGIGGVIGSRVSGGIQPAIVPGVPAIGSLMQLNVNSASACSAPVMRTAKVKAIGDHIIVMEDTLNPAGPTTADFEHIAATFDTLVYPVVTQHFGVPADIDGNGRVIALYTTAVNDLSPPGSGSYVGGFVYSRDLWSPATCPGSNAGEMFYMLAADPAGVHGNERDVDFIRKQTFGTLGHEFQHLINSSFRISSPGGYPSETVWLNEGLSHIAEELIYYRVSGYAPKQNIGVPHLVVSQTQIDNFFDYAEANVGRLRSWMLNPAGSGPFSTTDALSTRGAIWAFLRYAADRSGLDEATLWSSFISSGETGESNLTSRFATDPAPWFRDWAASMYIDDTGLAGIRAENRHLSWSFRSIYGALSYAGQPAFYPLAVRNPANGVGDSFTLAAGGGSAFVRVGVAATGFAAITTNTAPGASLGLTVIRRK